MAVKDKHKMFNDSKFYESETLSLRFCTEQNQHLQWHSLYSSCGRWEGYHEKLRQWVIKYIILLNITFGCYIGSISLPITSVISL
jgi:hypothetical protein